MDYQKIILSYSDQNQIEDYFYNSPADYYDLYDDEFNKLNQYDQSSINLDVHGVPSFWNNLSFYQLCSQCVLPAVWSTSNLLGTTLILCIFFRIFIFISNKIQIIPEAILHTVCAICGVLPIVLFHDDEGLYQLLLQVMLFPVFCYIITIMCTLTLKQHSSVVFSVIILLSLLYRECFLDDPKWQKTKSTHMLMSMKAMAVLFDHQSNKLHSFPSVVQYIGYMMCAGTVYLGPFLTYQEYSNAFMLSDYWNTTKVCRVLWKIIISLLCFVLSICVIDWSLSQNVYSNENSSTIIDILLTMYKQALEFRTGHYFVAYASTVFAIVCGYRCDNNSEILVTNPMTVEWPQSLLKVVVHWNRPMHFWLKKYIFQEVLKYSSKKFKQRNIIIAVGTTYLISSLLHGFERRLSAVLLSLAAYTFIEHQIRKKLAIRFPRTFSYNSKYDCHYYECKTSLKRSKKKIWILWSIDIAFTILNIIHLAYLGSVMDMTVKDSDNTTFQDYFLPWRRVSYFSHFIVLFMYLISIIL